MARPYTAAKMVTLLASSSLLLEQAWSRKGGSKFYDIEVEFRLHMYNTTIFDFFVFMWEILIIMSMRENVDNNY